MLIIILSCDDKQLTRMKRKYKMMTREAEVLSMEFMESDTIELKSELIPDICREVIAFANSHGGTIYTCTFYYRIRALLQRTQASQDAAPVQYG